MGDDNNDKLTEATTKLEAGEKQITEMEGEAAAHQRRIQLLEEDHEKLEERLNIATEKLEEASKAADDSERGRKVLESRSQADDERIDTLEAQLKEAKFIAEDAERKYDEAKILELEEELKVVGNNMKSLEISEQEASQREDSYEETIRDLTQRLKEAENRSSDAERTVGKLQKEVDRLEDELLSEKERYKSISDELDSTFAELAGY